MKIIYAKFINFSGIYAGIGVEEIELDFSKADNVITMLLGGNGAGKTTIMSLLHPYRGTNDSRANFILEGKKGLKEIHLQEKKDIYKIQHYYGSQSSHNKSFIQKNGEEMNANGGIKTFDSYLQEEFNLNKDYFRIARLGSNVTTFIDLKTAERKKYINNFLPDIDDYLSKFEIVNDKFKMLNNSIKVINTQLDKLDDKEILLEQKAQIQGNIEATTRLINTVRNLIQRNNFNIEKLQEESDVNGDYNLYMKQLEQSIKTLQVNLETAKNIHSTVIKRGPALADFTDEQLVEYRQKYDLQNNTFMSEIKHETEKRDNAKAQLVTVNNKLVRLHNSLSDEVDLSLIENQIGQIQQSITDTKEKLFKNQYAELVLTDHQYTQLQIISGNIMTAIETFKASTSPDLAEEVLTEGQVNELIATYNENTGHIVTLNEKIGMLNTELTKIQSNEYLLETLEKRPANCKIDTCPFIVRAVNYKTNDYSRIDGIASEMKDLEITVSNMTNNNEVLVARITTQQAIQKFYKTIELQFEPLINILYKNVTIDKAFAQKLLTTDISILAKKLSVDEVVQANSIRKDITMLELKLESLESHYSTAKQKQEVNEGIRKDIEAVTKEVNDFKVHISEFDGIINEINGKIEKNNLRISLIDSIVTSKKDVANYTSQLNEKMDDYNNKVSNYQQILQLQDENKDLEGKKNMHGITLRQQEEFLKKVDKDLVIVEDCSERLANINKKYDNVKLVQKALDPKKGIPLFFIDNYLKDIAVKANELLAVAYGDSFKIKFDINASDFFINVFKSDGTFLPDISEASQGEISLTTVSLSLGMIERIMTNTKFNILYLDEVDSTLSTKNRRLFISLLETQLQKLGIEQVFIISHNNEFEAHPINMILLKENNIDVEDVEFMAGKKVVFNYADIKTKQLV